MNSGNEKLNNECRFFISITSFLNDSIKSHKNAQKIKKKLNRFFLVFPSINRTETDRFEPISVLIFFKRKIGFVIF